MKTVFAIIRVPRFWSGDLGEGAVLDGAGDKHVGCGITNQVGATRCVFNDDSHPENCVLITLETGEIYYIEAIFKEHEGGDNCAVAWQGPGIPQRVVIPGSYLSPVHDGECTTIAYYIDGLSEQVQLGSRLKIEFAAEPIDAGDLPCEPGGANHYVFTHETEVDQVIAGMGLNYFGARYYDASLGRWNSVDRRHQHPVPYVYAVNNPINNFDPDGNVSISSSVGVRAGFIFVGGVSLKGSYNINAIAKGLSEKAEFLPKVSSKLDLIAQKLDAFDRKSGGMLKNSTQPMISSSLDKSFAGVGAAILGFAGFGVNVGDPSEYSVGGAGELTLTIGGKGSLATEFNESDSPVGTTYSVGGALGIGVEAGAEMSSTIHKFSEM